MIAAVATIVAAGAMGLAGSFHCASMCGGVASTLCRSTNGEAGRARSKSTEAIFHAARIASYAAMGALVGGAGHLVWAASSPAATEVMRGIAALFVVAIGADLMGWWPKLALPRTTVATNVLRRASRIFGTSPRGRALFGLAWGVLPCGLLYGALATAVMSGSALGGASAMLAFGLVTWPAMLIAGRLLTYLRTTGAPSLRKLAGCAIAILGCTMAFPSIQNLTSLARGERLQGASCCPDHHAHAE